LLKPTLVELLLLSKHKRFESIEGRINHLSAAQLEKLQGGLGKHYEFNPLKSLDPAHQRVDRLLSARLTEITGHTHYSWKILKKSRLP